LSHHFGAGQYDRHHWFRLDLQFVVASHSSERKVGGVQYCACRDQHFTGGSFFACRTKVLARPRFAFLCVVIEPQEKAAVSVLVDLAAFLAEYRLGAGRDQSAGSYDAGTPGEQKGFVVGKDPWTAAVNGPAVHGRGVIMGEFLQGGDVAGKGATHCQWERDIHGRERDRAIES
jgi:hypothetical protein